ncbi:hypothetical protein [Weissella cibaria]|uniref:Uncharacterized protein n=1 Tax=Weissella cibaria TaxID=137591 RepID=A0A9Q8JI12_9LACO|nr:hypothetical protein [Weissella cibaria]MBS6379601.1 hypothetical protein [Weissella confusa]TVV27514.1 hypothetical protein FO435_06265 [Weissella cibaria]TVV40706.1 hypothetical protein FO438_06095 [Weissella cibaria]
MSYQYVAVDVTRSKILLVGETLQDLNKQLLSEQGQKLVHKQAVWMYRVDAEMLAKIQHVMAKTGASFARVTQPVE